MNGGQRRAKVAGVAHVIITDQRNILRHAQTHFIRRADGAHRHNIPAAEDGRWARVLAENLLHGAVAGFRLKIALHNPVFRNANLRLFHRFHKTCQPACAGVTLQRAGDHADIAMPAFNKVAPGDIAAFKGVIDNRVGEVGFCLAPVHHYHRNMTILFQHA